MLSFTTCFYIIQSFILLYFFYISSCQLQTHMQFTCLATATGYMCIRPCSSVHGKYLGHAFSER